MVDRRKFWSRVQSWYQVFSHAESTVTVQVCHAAAAKPMWQLRGGRLVHLRDGCFLQVRIRTSMQDLHTFLPLVWRSRSQNPRCDEHTGKVAVDICACGNLGPLKRDTSWVCMRHPCLHLLQERVGCLMQATSSQLGAAALDLIQSTMPVFDAPWHVMEALEAAGVPQLTSTTPGRVRLAPVKIELNCICNLTY